MPDAPKANPAGNAGSRTGEGKPSMQQKVPPAVFAVIIAVVVIVIAFFGYKTLVPQKVLLAPGTKIPPMPQAPNRPGIGGGPSAMPSGGGMPGR